MTVPAGCYYDPARREVFHVVATDGRHVVVDRSPATVEAGGPGRYPPRLLGQPFRGDPTGTTDQTVALQPWIDRLDGPGIIPPGRYRCDRTVHLTRPTRLTFAPGAVLISHGKQRPHDGVLWARHTQVHIDGLTIDGQNHDHLGVKLTGCTGRIAGFDLRNVGRSAIGAWDCDRLDLIGGTVHAAQTVDGDGTDAGCVQVDNCTRVLLAGIDLTGSTGKGIAVRRTHVGTVEHCHVSGGSNGFYSNHSSNIVWRSLSVRDAVGDSMKLSRMSTDHQVERSVTLHHTTGAGLAFRGQGVSRSWLAPTIIVSGGFDHNAAADVQGHVVYDAPCDRNVVSFDVTNLRPIAGRPQRAFDVRETATNTTVEHARIAGFRYGIADQGTNTVIRHCDFDVTVQDVIDGAVPPSGRQVYQNRSALTER